MECFGLHCIVKCSCYFEKHLYMYLTFWPIQPSYSNLCKHKDISAFMQMCLHVMQVDAGASTHPQCTHTCQVACVLTSAVFEISYSRLCSRQQQQQQKAAFRAVQAVSGWTPQGPLHCNVTISLDLLTYCNTPKQGKNNTAFAQLTWLKMPILISLCNI